MEKRNFGSLIAAAMSLMLLVAMTGCAHYAKSSVPQQQVNFHCLPEVNKCSCTDTLDCWILGDSGLCRGPIQCEGRDFCSCELGVSTLSVVEFVEPYEDLEIANPENPFDRVGVYHNAGVDYVLESLRETSSDARGRLLQVQSLVAGFTSLVGASLELPEVRDQARQAGTSTVEALLRSQLEPSPVGFVEAGREATYCQLGRDEYRVFVETWDRVDQIIADVESGRASYEEYQSQIREIESRLLEEQPVAASAPSLLMLSVARYSAHQVRESDRVPPRAKIRWWNVAKQDLIGAATGSKLGIWGAVAGGVIYSAVEIIDQTSDDEVES